MRRTRKNYFAAVMFMFFVLISSFTLMNMLVGVLCEVVTKTAMTDMTTTIMLPKSPFLCTASGNLSSPSRENLDTHLRSARTFSRRVLEVDLLTDPQEATFGITPANVAVHLEQRVALEEQAAEQRHGAEGGQNCGGPSAAKLLE